MSYPIGYDPAALACQVKIYDTAHVLKYTYQMNQIVGGAPTQDFSLKSVKLHGGINTDLGSCTLIINDPNSTLLDTTDPNRPCIIKGQWEVEVQCGKNAAGLTPWFVGKIQEPTINKQGSKFQEIELFCLGWGIVLAERSTILKFFQAKSSDGLTLDTTDVKAYVSAIVTKLLQDIDHLPNPGLPNTGISASLIDTITVQMADYQKNFQSIASAISELANAAGAIYGVDATKTMWMRYRGTKDSGMLFTDDLASIQTLNWDKTKFGILKKMSPPSWIDSTMGYGIAFLNGVGAFHDVIDQSNTSSNATYDLSSNYFNIPFTPTIDNASKLGLFLTRVGTPGNDLYVSIVADDNTGKPNFASIIKKLVIRKETLLNLSLTGTWYELAFEKESLQPNIKYHIAFTKYQDATNKIKIDYQTGTGTYHDSPDGVTWTARTGNPKFRQYASKPIVVMLENTVSKKSFGTREITIPLNDIPNEDGAIQAMIGYSDSMGKVRRTYKSILISPPDLPLQLGQTLRIRDLKSGLDVNCDLISYDLEMSALKPIGTSQITIGVEQVFYQT